MSTWQSCFPPLVSYCISWRSWSPFIWHRNQLLKITCDQPALQKCKIVIIKIKGQRRLFSYLPLRRTFISKYFLQGWRKALQQEERNLFSFFFLHSYMVPVQPWLKVFFFGSICISVLATSAWYRPWCHETELGRSLVTKNGFISPLPSCWIHGIICYVHRNGIRCCITVYKIEALMSEEKFQWLQAGHVACSRNEVHHGVDSQLQHFKF